MSGRRRALLLFLALQAARTPTSTSGKQVFLSIIYETRCSDSKNFVTTQLYPTYRALGKDKVVLEFKPFGKATYSEPSADSPSYNFTCQHGPAECAGNLLHACLLSKLADGDQQVEVLNCMMKDRDPDKVVEKCMRETGIAEPSYSSVSTCANSTEGRSLIKKYQDDQNRLSPKLDFVPWILINNEFDRTEFQAALKNLKWVLERRMAGIRPDGAAANRFGGIKIG